MSTELRLDLVGCSDLPALLGLDPYRGELELWLRIVYGIEPILGTYVREAGRLGQNLEEGIARSYLDLRKPGSESWSMLKPPSRPHPGGMDSMRYSLDFVARSGRRTELLECKLRRYRSWKAQGFDEDSPSASVLVQVQGQLACMSLDRAFWLEEQALDPDELGEATILALVDGLDLKAYPVTRDRSLGAALLERVADFWGRHVEPKVPPPVGGARQAGWALEILRDMGEIQKGKRPVDDVDRELLAEIARTEAERESYQREVDALDQHARSLRHRLGQRTLDWGGIEGVAEWKTQRGRVSWKQLAQDLQTQAGLSKGQVKSLEDKYRGAPATEFRLVADNR